MKNFKIKFSIIKYFFVFAIFFTAVPVLASEFSFDTPSKDISIGQQFQIDLNINTEKENINAVEGSIIFPTNLLELSDIRYGNSIVNFWVEKPVYKDGTVVFSGITPGGYVLDKGLILSIIFKAKKEGNALVRIENGSALQNDGNGTKSILKTSDLQVNISSASQNKGNKNFTVIDKTPPDTFKPEIGHDQNLFDNKWFVAFTAQDKNSGIDRYEVRESRYFIFNSSKWVPAISPYILTDQKLQSNIYVKAIDKSGNERIVKLSPQNPMPWYANIEDWFIIILVAIVAFIFYLKKIKNKH